MESIEQEINQNKKMAREYDKMANVFVLLCCCTGIPLLLIGTFNYNSKASTCRRRIRALEEQIQQTQIIPDIIHCQSCGHRISEVITYCPLCGVEIDFSSAKNQQSILVVDKTSANIGSVQKPISNDYLRRKKIDQGIGSIVLAVIVLAFPTWISVKIGAVTIFSCWLSFIGIAIAVSVLKYEKKLGIAGIVLNILGIVAVIIMIIITYTIIGGPIGLFTSF